MHCCCCCCTQPGCHHCTALLCIALQRWAPRAAAACIKFLTWGVYHSPPCPVRPALPCPALPRPGVRPGTRTRTAAPHVFGDVTAMRETEIR